METQSRFAERLKAKLDAIIPDPETVETWRWRITELRFVPVFLALAKEFEFKLERPTRTKTLAQVIDVTGPLKQLELFRDTGWGSLREASGEAIDAYLQHSVCKEAEIEYVKDAFDQLPEIEREGKAVTKEIVE